MPSQKIESLSQLTDPQFLLALFLDPHGRLNRLAFTTALGLLTILVAVVIFALSFVGLFFRAMEFTLLTDLIFFIPMFFWGYSAATLIAKRLHDLNLSGWWGLPGLIPLFGTLPLFIILFLIRGSDGDNKFGADPVVI
jgi:uncharacterized membrane protein YhaH (DUF805 family)